MTIVSPVAAARVQSAIASAASRTGVDFGYLLGQARLESGLNASAKAGTSSASGLYQFIEQSWLAVVKKHGADHGLGWAANSIERSASGKLTVGDPATRQAILGLRNDPEASSLMAAAYAGDNKASLETSLGRAATGTDLYMAHFLGLAGARRFLQTMAANPQASGAALFPQAAAANRNVFFDGDGQARSLQDIYQHFAGKLSSAGAAVPSAYSYGTQALDLDGATVVTGANENATEAMSWARSTLGRLGGRDGGSLLRPTPDTARLAYLMLAQLGTS
ncbi:lytic transglycosylase domain-containing protein [Sphingomonas bacterium]|uniref:lytic transglycosylase domain-containing protein n=1 Tax=Sphingomonas bacterium TaxID=1895847 RepID=UPI001576936B|nr:lytic transglycosylase domain-containing protein [Sphingomonas bacterium]